MTAPIEIREARSDDAEAATDVLRRSIMELGVLDHRNDPERLASWLSNKQPDVFRSWVDDPARRFYEAAGCRLRRGEAISDGSSLPMEKWHRMDGEG